MCDNIVPNIPDSCNGNQDCINFNTIQPQRQLGPTRPRDTGIPACLAEDLVKTGVVQILNGAPSLVESMETVWCQQNPEHCNPDGSLSQMAYSLLYDVAMTRYNRNLKVWKSDPTQCYFDLAKSCDNAGWACTPQVCEQFTCTGTNDGFGRACQLDNTGKSCRGDDTSSNYNCELSCSKWKDLHYHKNEPLNLDSNIVSWNEPNWYFDCDRGDECLYDVDKNSEYQFSGDDMFQCHAHAGYTRQCSAYTNFANDTCLASGGSSGH